MHLSLSQPISHVYERIQVVNCSVRLDARPWWRWLEPLFTFHIWPLHVSPVRGKCGQILFSWNHPKLSVVVLLKLGITAKSSLTVFIDATLSSCAVADSTACNAAAACVPAAFDPAIFCVEYAVVISVITNFC